MRALACASRPENRDGGTTTLSLRGCSSRGSRGWPSALGVRCCGMREALVVWDREQAPGEV